MDGNDNLDIAGNCSNVYIPATPSLASAMIPTKMPNNNKTNTLLEAPEVDPATARLENYCTLNQHLMTEVEAEEYNIGHDLRRRIRDDVIHTHKRETRLLREVHGHTELEKKMREKPWRLIEMAEQKVEEGERSQMEQRAGSSSGAKGCLVPRRWPPKSLFQPKSPVPRGQNPRLRKGL